MTYSHEKLAQLDKQYLWHPFTQMAEWQDEDITIIEEGEGCFITDLKGKSYIDGISSLWCNVHGHRRPEIDAAIQDQLKHIAHSTFLGLSNPPAILLAEKLIGLAPKGLTRVFYSDSGSEAVEVALKMAYQYWREKGRSKKQKFVRFANAYHGDTIGSVSVGGIELFHDIYKPLLFETFEIPSPYCYRWPTSLTHEEVGRECLRRMEELLREKSGEIAAVVMEPLMQGAAGMIDQPAGFISSVRELTQKYNVLLIFDEVATGFGRTGKMFAADHENVMPDLMALAKGLTGGYLPLSATLATEEIYDAFETFFHGHTYTGNPLAARAALASLEIFETDHTLGRLQPKIALMKERLDEIRTFDSVGDVRQAGFMAGIELVCDKATKKPYPPSEKIGHQVCRKAREQGVWIRPLGNVIVLMPPLAIPQDVLVDLMNGVAASIRATRGQTPEKAAL